MYDVLSIAKTISMVASQAGDFVTDSLKLSVSTLRSTSPRSIEPPPKCAEHAGAVRRHMATVLRTSGLLAGSAGAVLGIIALTNLWNPAGWVAAVILVD